VFHAHNDYVRLQPQPFRVRKRVANQQNPGTVPSSRSGACLCNSISASERAMHFHIVERVGRSLLTL